MKKITLKSGIMLFMTAFIWGVAFVAQSVGMKYIEPFTFNCVRSLLGGLVLIPCIWFLNKRDKQNAENNDREPMTKAEKKMLILGGVCCGIALFFASNLQQFGVKYTTVGKAGFITALYIVLVPILGLFLKKHVGIKIWISVGISVIGLYLLCITDGLSISKGDFFVLLCAFVFAIHILVIDYFSPKTDGVIMSCIQFFVCSALTAVPMILFEEPSVNAIVMAAVPLLYAGILSSGVAYTLQVLAQKDTDPTIASLILSLESVFSVLAGFFVLHQALSKRELLGCVLMFGAIILAQLPEKNKEVFYANKIGNEMDGSES